MDVTPDGEFKGDAAGAKEAKKKSGQSMNRMAAAKKMRKETAGIFAAGEELDEGAIEALEEARGRRRLRITILGKEEAAIKINQLGMAVKKQSDLIDFLIENGASVDAHIYDELLTPLHIAAGMNNATAVHTLIDHGAKISKSNKAEETPWKYAKRFGADVANEVISLRYVATQENRQAKEKKKSKMKAGSGWAMCGGRSCG